MKKTAAVVLAAGQGTRMDSDLPKVLHPLGGVPIIDHVLKALAPLDFDRTIVVIGYQADKVRQAISTHEVETALQADQLGTGHAVMQAEPALAGFDGTVLVMTGDVPLLTPETLRAFLQYHEDSGAACTVMSTKLADPDGYGRILRGPDGGVQDIVEHKDATPEQQQIQEINTGILAFAAAPLFAHIREVKRGNAQAEYYLTDLVGIFRGHNLPVAGYCVENDLEVRGVNSPEQLAELERIYKGR